MLLIINWLINNDNSFSAKHYLGCYILTCYSWLAAHSNSNMSCACCCKIKCPAIHAILNKNVSIVHRKITVTLKVFSSNGRWFQARGPATEKERSLIVLMDDCRTRLWWLACRSFGTEDTRVISFGCRKKHVHWLRGKRAGTVWIQSFALLAADGASTERWRHTKRTAESLQVIETGAGESSDWSFQCSSRSRNKLRDHGLEW